MENYQTENNYTYNNFETASSIEKRLSMLMYILGFLTWVIGPVILFLLFRQQSSYFKKRSKDFFNFQISYLIYLVVLIFFSGDMPFLILFIIVLSIMMHVFYIIGAVKMEKGKKYIAPLSIRLFK